MFMNKEAINEIWDLHCKVKEVQKLVKEMGITYHSDSWSGVDTNNIKTNFEYEDILNWTKETYENIDISDVTCFNLGGCVSTCQHEFNNEYINEPKYLALNKYYTVKNFLENIVKNFKCNYFNIKVETPYPLFDNCGWEAYIIISVVPIKDKCYEYISLFDLFKIADKSKKKNPKIWFSNKKNIDNIIMLDENDDIIIDINWNLIK